MAVTPGAEQTNPIVYRYQTSTPQSPVDRGHAPLSHADAMQITPFCMAPFQACDFVTNLLDFWRARKDSNLRPPDS